MQHGFISNAHIIPERTNSKRIKVRGEAGEIHTSISPPIGAIYTENIKTCFAITHFKITFYCKIKKEK